MKQLMKWVALVFVLAGHVAAQTSGQNVRGLQWIANQTVTTNPTTITSIDLPNIGQTSHSARVSVSGGTHTWGAIYAAIQGSMDGSTWFPIGPAVVTTPAITEATPVVMAGYGTYPHLRCTITIAPGSGDTLTVNGYYYGNITPAAVSIDTVNSFTPVVFSATGVAVPTTAATVIGSAGPNLSLVMYGLFFGGGTSITGIRVQCSPSGNDLFFYQGITSAAPIVLPASLRPYAACLPNDSVTVTTTGTGGVPSLALTYRYE